ncbi:MAG: NAD(P)H-hydrate dehydratase [Candidatus Aenigmarchaeota archaeon]|nr:NAD(P)H-hydrate dehydratase [Candidatus Aenigmarchaeota archaeon]
MLVTKSILKNVYKPRTPWAHKGNFGSLLVVGGSRMYSGTVAFNALAALRAGCDLVTIAAPERAADTAAAFSPDIIAYPLKGDFLAARHLKELEKLKEGKDALVVGGGMGREKETMDAINTFLSGIEIPSVIDADAIHAVAGNRKVIQSNFVITPHTVEFHVLTGEKAGNDVKERALQAKKYAAEFRCTVVLKGHVDVISDGTRTALNRTGSPYMTKGGTGDTLAGICGSLLAQDNDPFTAACAAAYINGKAGEIAAKEKRQGLLASDIIEKIPEAVRDHVHNAS